MPIPSVAFSVLVSILSSFVLEPTLAALVQEPPLVLKYHGGPLLKGTIPVNLIWYGQFTPAQKSIIVDFLQSLSAPHAAEPSAKKWWNTTEKYQGVGANKIVIGKQIVDGSYSLGKSLENSDIVNLAAKVGYVNGAINVVLTAKDVYVEGFCMRCRLHGSTQGKTRFPYAWVGNSETQCPGQCAWPFHQPIYGPKDPALVAPNGDVGVDGMIINLATVLAGIVTNPFNTGYFRGPATEPLEAVSACNGKYGSGAYPGYPGQILVDKKTGASYNANGVDGRKFLVPGMWDPQTTKCSTLT